MKHEGDICTISIEQLDICVTENAIPASETLSAAETAFSLLPPSPLSPHTEMTCRMSP